MEDFILREIDKIGVVIRGLLARLGLLRTPDCGPEACAVVKTELLGSLNLDLGALLENERFIDVPAGEHGFKAEHLELFAELLADLAAASDDRAERRRLAACAGAVYTYLDRTGVPASLNRYYILKELERYIE